MTQAQLEKLLDINERAREAGIYFCFWQDNTGSIAWAFDTEFPSSMRINTRLLTGTAQTDDFDNQILKAKRFVNSRLAANPYR